jgi:hypothetical protein
LDAACGEGAGGGQADVAQPEDAEGLEVQWRLLLDRAYYTTGKFLFLRCQLPSPQRV